MCLSLDYSCGFCLLYYSMLWSKEIVYSSFYNQLENVIDVNHINIKYLFSYILSLGKHV